MTTSSKELPVVEVTSGTAMEIRFNRSDYYFGSNTGGKNKYILTACTHTHEVTSMTIGRPLLVKIGHYKGALNL